MSVTISLLGASLADLICHMPSGEKRRILLSPLTHRRALSDPSLAGRTVAPACGRIRDGMIIISDNAITLEKNEGPNHIHGGSSGAANLMWNLEFHSESALGLSLRLPSGTSGYPGNRLLTTRYTLSGNTLSVEYTANTDEPTFMDITNHAYWDVTGKFDGSAMNTLLEVSALDHVVNDENHLPLQIVPSGGTAFDFSKPDMPSNRMRAFPNESQLRIARGYNNALVLDPDLVRENGFAARMTDPVSGLRLTMNTDRPCLVFYSGGYLGEDTPLAEGPSVPGCALALEAQGLPDPFHLSGATAPILFPGREFRANIAWTVDIPGNECCSSLSRLTND